MSSLGRLTRLEKSIRAIDLTGKQFAGRYYDELSAEERYLWLKYHDSLIAPQREVDVEAFEQVCACLSGDLHFICEDRPKPPTEAEFRGRVAWVEQQINNYKKTEEEERS